MRFQARLESPGVQTLRVACEGHEAASKPVRVGDHPLRIYWGSLHNHSAVGGHAASSTCKAIRYASEESRLDFVAMTEHDERRQDDFDLREQWRLAHLFDEPGRFVTFGFESKHDPRTIVPSSTRTSVR